MAAEPKKKISKVRSKTRRAHRHTSLVNENLWQSGRTTKKERKEKLALMQRKRTLANTPAATKAEAKAEPKAPKATKPEAKKPASKPAPKKTTKKKE